MTSELRIIRFRLNEVTAAVKSFAPRIKLQVPDTVILSAHAAPDGTPNALLRYGEAGTDIVISNSQLAASLIAYCHSIKLPLPQEGQKSIQVSKEHIDLRINMLDIYGQAVTVLASAADVAASEEASIPAIHVD